MKIYDFSEISHLDENEKLIVNMNTALLTFHTEEDILAFRNTHLNWLLLYDLKLNTHDYMHARMAYNAYGDIVSVLPSISENALMNLMTIADYCHGDVLMDLCDTHNPNKKADYALHAGVKYIIGCEHIGLITCSYGDSFTSNSSEENI